MPKINLRDLYPGFYKTDFTIDVPDEVLSVFVEHECQEAAYRRKMYRYRAQYSLDRNDGIETDIQFVALSPDERYGRKLTAQQLHAAIAALHLLNHFKITRSIPTYAAPTIISQMDKVCKTISDCVFLQKRFLIFYGYAFLFVLVLAA